MSSRRFVKAIWLMALLALLALPAVPALAWWSGWYSPNFSGSYSPSSYRHGQWNSSAGGGTEVFGSEMQWNQTRANGVRAYSNNRNWIWFCGNCYSYYTHDHTDMSDRLDAYGYSTNFPNASIDADDDNGNGRWEEIEATSVNQSFPPANTTYYFYSYFRRARSGTGTLYETPQISARNAVSGEWDTYRYDSNQSLSYSTYDTISQAPTEDGSQQNDLRELTRPTSETPFTSTVSLGQYVMVMQGSKEASLLQASVGQTLQSTENLTEYVRWAQTDVVDALRKANAPQVLTVVTFKQPVNTDLIDALVGKASSPFPVEAIKAIYVDKSNSDPNSNVWTVGAWPEKGSDYRQVLDDIAADVATNGLGQEDQPALALQGIVAANIWLPLEMVETLNAQDDVLLADASPSYLRLVAASTQEASDLGNKLDKYETLADGLPSYIVAEVPDLYAEARAFLEDAK